MIEAKASVEITRSAQAIWDYLIRIDDWWLRSNPKEHVELSLVNGNGIEEGSRFVLKEYIAGVRGEALAEVVEVIPLRRVVWKSIHARYRFLGLRLRVEEGGTFELVPGTSGWVLSHHVWGTLQGSRLLSALAEWFFKVLLKGEKKDDEHTRRELLFVKKEIEQRATQWDSAGRN